MSSKSQQGNLAIDPITGKHYRDGEFGGTDQIKRISWQPGDSIGCNFGSNNPGVRRGDKPVAPGFRKVR